MKANERARTYLKDPIRFSEEQFIVPETRKLIVLEDWQKEYIFKPVFYDLDRHRRRKYNVVLIGVPKKNGKSTIAAVIGVYELFAGEPSGEIIIAANDKEQASMIIYSKIRQAVQLNSALESGVRAGKLSMENRATKTTARFIAHQFESAAGLNPSLTLFDELWGFSDRRFYDELTVVPTRRDPLIVIVTYAGYESQGLLWDLYQDGMEGDDIIKIPDREIFVKRGKRDKRMFMLWSHENLSKWVTKEYLKSQQSRLPPPVYARLHENRWVSQVGRFIGQSDIDRILQPDWRPQYIPDVEGGHRYIMATDLGLSSDRTAVAIGHFDSRDSKVYLDSLRLWEGTSEEHVPVDLVETYMFEQAGKFHVHKIVCDPWQMEHAIQRLRGIYSVRAFNFHSDMTHLSQVVMNLISSGTLVIYNTPELIDELRNAIIKETPRGWKFEHTRKGRNDCIVAVGMMSLEAVESQYRVPTIYY